MTRIAYTLRLTAAEYRDAAFMDARGYLGQIITHAWAETWNADETIVRLEYTEPDAWNVIATCEADEHAVYALTDTRTTLGAKFQTFRDSIV